MNDTPLIELSDVRKSFARGEESFEVLHGVSLRIEEGEFIAIMGRSGSGKTTLMNIIGCMARPSGGSYRLCGRDVVALDGDELAELRRDMFGFIFQRYNLLGNATALENVEMPAIYAGLPASQRRARAAALLNLLGLDTHHDFLPGRMSGGQQQRVAIARALINGARVILADEPTGALDSASGKEVLEHLHQLHRRGHTVILITHDPVVANEADRTIQISDGRIVGDSGPAPALRERPIPQPAGATGGCGGLLVDVTASVRTAMRALQANPVRAFLTLLGVMIGVGSVVAMLAFGNGARQAVLARIQALGPNLLMVKPGAPGVRGSAMAVTTLVPSDATAISRLPNVQYVIPQMVDPTTVTFRAHSYTTTLDGTTVDFPRGSHWPVATGSFFTEAEYRSYAPVVVVGTTVARALFAPGMSPIGHTIMVGNVPLRVIGVLAAKGANQQGVDQDDVVVTPMTTAQARITGQNYLKWITVAVRDVKIIPATERMIHALLLWRHHILDFQVQSMTALLQNQAATQSTLTLMLGAVAVISLVVGGIGVMNIMLVSVVERTREIGIRMATGARLFHILLQFITESIVICTMGGLVGVSGGLIVAAAAAAFTGAAVVFSVPPVLIAFGSAVATGVVFGYVPARHAASLDPVVALAQE